MVVAKLQRVSCSVAFKATCPKKFFSVQARRFATVVAKLQSVSCSVAFKATCPKKFFSVQAKVQSVKIFLFYFARVNPYLPPKKFD